MRQLSSQSIEPRIRIRWMDCFQRMQLWCASKQLLFSAASPGISLGPSTSAATPGKVAWCEASSLGIDKCVGTVLILYPKVNEFHGQKDSNVAQVSMRIHCKFVPGVFVSGTSRRC